MGVGAAAGETPSFKLDPRRNTPRHIIITLAKMKQKKRIVEAAREKELPTKEFP